MQNGDEASPSISLAGRGQLVKMFITLNHTVYLNQSLYTYRGYYTSGYFK